jgi:hypothetical protein
LGTAFFIGSIALALWLGRDAIVKSIAQRRIRERTGFTAQIGELKTSLGSVKISAKHFKLFNPPEFGGPAVLDIPELYMELDARALADGRIHFHELRLHLAELNLIKGKTVTLNLKELGEAFLAKPRDGFKLRFYYGGIDRLSLTVGKLSYADLRQPQRHREYQLGLKDERAEHLETEEELRNWLGAIVFRLVLQQCFEESGGGSDRDLRQLLDTFREK